jgi:hypothetical protein
MCGTRDGVVLIKYLEAGKAGVLGMIAEVRGTAREFRFGC